MKNKSLIYGIGILGVLGFMVSHQKSEDSKRDLRKTQALALQKISAPSPLPLATLEIEKAKPKAKAIQEKTIEAIAKQQAAVPGELEPVETLWQETLEAAYARINVSREESAVIASMRQTFQQEYHSLDEQYQKATSRSRRDLLQMMSRDAEKKFDQHVQEFLGEDRFAQLQSTREQFNQDLDEKSDLRPRVMSYW